MDTTANSYEGKLRSLLIEMDLVEDYINGIFDFVSDPSDQKALIDFIETGDDVDLETIAIRALDLFDFRNSS